MNIYFLSQLEYEWWITIKFCTWHNSIAVVPCAKYCGDPLTSEIEIQHHISCMRFEVWVKNPWVKWTTWVGRLMGGRNTTNIDKTGVEFGYCKVNTAKLFKTTQSSCLMVGGPLWPPDVPGLAARPSQSNPRGSGPEVWKPAGSRVRWPPKFRVSEVFGVSEVGVFRALQPNDHEMCVGCVVRDVFCEFNKVWLFKFFLLHCIGIMRCVCMCVCMHTYMHVCGKVCSKGSNWQ